MYLGPFTQTIGADERLYQQFEIRNTDCCCPTCNLGYYRPPSAYQIAMLLPPLVGHIRELRKTAECLVDPSIRNSLHVGFG
jgi:hypothetical protein